MTYIAELEPRRRRPWLIALPLAIVVALGVAWTALWFYAAGEAETRLDDWQRPAGEGRARVHLRQPVGRRLSVPHRGALHRRDGGTEGRAAADRDQAEGDPRGRAGVGPEADHRGVHRAAHGVGPGRAPYVTATWALAQASVRGTPKRAGARLDRGRRAASSRADAGQPVRLQARGVSRARAVRLVAAQSGGRSRGEARRRRGARGARARRRSRSTRTFWRCCTA